MALVEVAAITSMEIRLIQEATEASVVVAEGIARITEATAASVAEVVPRLAIMAEPAASAAEVAAMVIAAVAPEPVVLEQEEDRLCQALLREAEEEDSVLVGQYS